MTNKLKKYGAMLKNRQQKKLIHIGGFTLIESLISIAIFAMLAGVIYQTFATVAKESALNWETTTISTLADQYLEAVRNISYSQIGTVAGNPSGTLPDISNPNNVVVNAKTYQVYYEVTYMDDPADGTILLGTDVSPNDYKQVKLTVNNTVTNSSNDFITNIVPTGLENMTSGGALFLSVIDSVGQPVSGATINITNTTLSPAINLTRTSSSTGGWIEVGLPDSSNSYHITVTKNGYSSDQTYPITLQNPSPTKPDATIANGQVTQISFAIDQTSNLTFNTLNQSCSPISGVGLGIRGSKIIGTPEVYKYDNTYTSNGSGQIVLNNIEWDNYTPGLVGNTYMIYGSSPIQQINILPNTSQLFNIILGNKTVDSLLVIVKDGSTGNPIEGASVHLENTGLGINSTLITGGSLWGQQFWNGGSGQADWLDSTKYFSDNGGVSTGDVPLALRLVNSNGNTLSTSGSLESSTFDTGSESTTYTTFEWQPTSQDPATEVKFQVATNNDNTTWDFVGPDGTNATYYTTPGTTIGVANNSNRYIRYKAFLSTTDITKNPTITSVGINYVSGCFTPGQVIFPGIAADTGYELTVSMPGYLTLVISGLEVSGYEVSTVILTTE